MTLIDLDYNEFVAKAMEMPPEVLHDLVEALEDRLRAIAGSRQKGDSGGEVRLLMSLAWNARKLAAIRSLLAEAKWKDEEERWA